MANGSPETRLGKNRVSTARNPVGKKPGFSGGRNPVGKKPGFSGARNPVGEKPGFDSWVKNRVSSIGLFAQQKPGFFKKPGFLDVSACKS
jgi:hypothetical protein